MTDRHQTTPTIPAWIEAMAGSLDARDMAGEANTLRHLAAQIERVRAACAAYEAQGFADPGRHMDDIRDALGRRS